MADQGAGDDGLEMLRNEMFRGAKQDLATALCEYALTLPCAKLTAGGKWAYICHVGQLLIRKIKFDALTPGAT